MVNTSLYNTLFSKSSKKIGGAKPDINELFNKKKSLLVPTFANLIFQLAITYYVMEIYSIKDKKDLPARTTKLWIYFLLQLVIIFTLGVFQLPIIVKFLLFVIFSYMFGVQLSYIKYFSGDAIVKFALLGTISIFAVMFSIGSFLLLTGINLGYKYGLVLFYALLGLILIRLITLFTGAITGFYKLLSIVSILLFSMFIIYDTNVILQRNYLGDFITASLDYYLDIINIFINLLSFNNN